ncbi:zona pellucida sperm-binding protein 3-like [Spea bombifrons]|uniref:zona pellucida sperm-binding protein 3-like n=1 Tax=Spea bombifrons TaxID=233779 RepID=UPI00234B8912|nr:zona pellucida sperm-binding protein 3-like [Spea bombifrons]
MEFWGQLIALGCCLITTLSAQKAPDNAVYYACNRTSIGLAVKIDPLGTGLRLNPSRLFLGTCNPSSTTALRGYFVFEYKLSECGFTTLAYGSNVNHLIDLVYSPSGSVQEYRQPFVEPVTCLFNRSLTPTVSPNVPVFAQLSGEGTLIFFAEIKKDDFSGPSDAKEFVLGSSISVELSVETAQHQPLQIYVDKCIAAPTLTLTAATQTYKLIDNHGCFIDGREAASTFKPRPSTNVIRLTFEAMRFIDFDTDVYLHFHVLVWDPKVQNDPTKKACSYLRESNRWELLDNPTRSSLCSCCDSVCKNTNRKKRNVEGVEEQSGLHHVMVLGPLKFQRQSVPGQNLDGNVSKTVPAQPGLPIPPAVGALLLEVLVLLVLSIGVAVYNRKPKTQEAEAANLLSAESYEPQK